MLMPAPHASRPPPLQALYASVDMQPPLGAPCDRRAAVLSVATAVQARLQRYDFAAVLT